MILESTKKRILQYIDYKEISVAIFLKNTGIKRGFLDGDKLEGKVSDEHLTKIVATYKDLNIYWLITGEGDMIMKERCVPIDSIPHGAVPYWNLPVSAGHSVEEIIGSTKPTGYIKDLPGIDVAENILPVSGMSMEPEISNGAIIGVRKMNNWDTLNTERIYLIITHEDRMIKRIEPDFENENVLWCVSPNYPRFKIYKSDIIEIQRVCFVYNPK